MSADNKSVIIAPTAEEVDKIRGYSIHKWRTFDNYCCVYCKYATLWIEKMQKHLDKGSHPWPYADKSAEGKALSPYEETQELEY
jgi:hypothetical protein